jgi:putative endonuclease
MDTYRKGREYEAAAVEYLERSGWRIVARNLRWKRKEIDLVVRRDRVVAFVEVKGRSGPGCGHPLEAITARKRRVIREVALAWIQRHGRPGDLFRFDAVAVHEGPAGLEIDHVEDAWRPG